MRRRRTLGGGGGSYNNDGDNETDDLDLDKPVWCITLEMMDRVDSSDWLRSELGGGGLRPMIFEIDEADLKALRSSGVKGADAMGAVILGFERATKVTGLPELAMPRFKLQLSSPIEELELTKICDPLNADTKGSMVRFEGVESSVATLMISSYDADVPLGSGAWHDMALLCKFDPMKPAGKAVMMIDVEIVPDESMAPLDAVTEKKATTLGNRSSLKEIP